MSPARRGRLLAWLPWVLVAAYLTLAVTHLPAWATALLIAVAVAAGLGVLAAGRQPRAEVLAASRERHPSVRSRMDASGTELYVPAEWTQERER